MFCGGGRSSSYLGSGKRNKHINYTVQFDEEFEVKVQACEQGIGNCSGNKLTNFRGVVFRD